jgi:hypothetical protein
MSGYLHTNSAIKPTLTSHACIFWGGDICATEKAFLRSVSFENLGTGGIHYIEPGLAGGLPKMKWDALN